MRKSRIAADGVGVIVLRARNPLLQRNLACIYPAEGPFRDSLIAGEPMVQFRKVRVEGLDSGAKR